MFHFPPNDFLLVLYHTSCNRLHYFAEKLVPYNQSETIENALGRFFLILQDRLYELRLMQEVLYQYLKEPLFQFQERNHDPQLIMPYWHFVQSKEL